MPEIRFGLWLAALLALPAASGAEVCPDVDTAALRGYTVREIRFETPFDFSRQLRSQFNSLKSSLPQKQGQPYDIALVQQGSELIASLGGPVQLGLPFNLMVAIAGVENCDAITAQPSLDLVYSLFTSRIPLFASGTPEAAAKEPTDPIQAAGLEQTQRFTLEPRVSYNRAAKTGLGAAFEVRDLGVIDSLLLDAQGSADSGSFDAAGYGSLPIEAAGLRQVDWSAGYHYADLPAASRRLRKTLGVAQVSALTGALAESGLLLRAGGSLERGTQHSAFSQSELPTGTLAEADYTGLKLFAGVSWRAPRQTFSASYGLQLASSGNGLGDDFRKHVFDANYQIRWLPRDFMPQELDLRVSAGMIDRRNDLPVSERFFGGSTATPFITGEAWQINAAPLIRSFAQNELARAGAHVAGGERFVSFNLTYAPTLWKIPLLPAELRDNPELATLTNAGLTTAQSTLDRIYVERDPAIKQIHGMVSEQERLKVQLEVVRSVFQAAEDQDKGELEERFFACADDLSAVVDADIAMMSAANLGNAAITIQSLLREGGRLDDLRKCAAELQAILGPNIDTALAALAPAEAALRTVYQKFDPLAAERMAKADLVFTRHVVERFFREINLVSVAPVLLLDAARLGPSVPGESSTRYGIGAGIRLTLVNSVRVTLAYSANPHPRNGERSGALNLSLDFVDLFY